MIVINDLDEAQPVRTVKELDEYRNALIWVKRPGSVFETSGVGLTRYGALKLLYGQRKAQSIRKLLPLESSALLSESQLDGSYIKFDTGLVISRTPSN